MFFDEKLTAKISRFNGEIGKRKDAEPENLIVLVFTGVGTADLLAHISPSMRSRLYVADDTPDLVGGKEATKIAMPELDNKYRVKDKVVGATAHIDYGIGSGIELGGCDIYAMEVVLQEGGNIIYSFKLKTKEITAKQVGIIHDTLNGREVNIVLTAPIKPNHELDV